MARGKAHPPELKAAVLAALLIGQSVDAVAEEYSLPADTVRNWSREAKTAAQLLATEKGGLDIGERIAHYLDKSLETLAVQVEHFRDREWLGRQDAADAAVLHGVLVDKVVRILQAAEAAGQRSDEDAAE